ncbi:hypothetical protein ABZ907_41075 [Nonomuraea wenchangensis]
MQPRASRLTCSPVRPSCTVLTRVLLSSISGGTEARNWSALQVKAARQRGSGGEGQAAEAAKEGRDPAKIGTWLPLFRDLLRAALKEGRTRTIGLVVPPAGRRLADLQPGFVAGVVDAAARADLDVLLSPSGGEHDRSFERIVTGRRVDGGLPLVGIGRTGHPEEMSGVDIDHDTLVARCIQHPADLGHRHPRPDRGEDPKPQGAEPGQSIDGGRLTKVWPPEMPVSGPRSTISMPRVRHGAEVCADLPGA